MIKRLLHIALFMALLLPLQAQVEMVTASDEGRIYLRWKGYRQSDLNGYHVYRSPAGQDNWQRLTTELQAPIWEVDEIREILGFKTYLYLSLFRLDEEVDRIPPELIDTIFQQPSPMFEVMTLINPEFGWVLGQVYVDSSVVSGNAYDYRVSAVGDETDENWVTKRNVRCCAPTLIPEPDFSYPLAGDDKVTLYWDKQANHLETGRVTTYHLYRGTNVLGLFEPVNLTGLLPVTVTSGDYVSGEDTMSYVDRFVTNGETYYYFIVPVDPFGREGSPTPLMEATPGSVLTPPLQLRYQTVANQLEIRWSAAAGAEGYQVFRSTEREGPYAPQGVAKYDLGQAATFHAEPIDPDIRELYFYIRSWHPAKVNSVPSDTLRISLPDAYPPTAPTGLSALSERGEITLQWNANSESDILGYRLYRTSDTAFASAFLLQAELLTDMIYTDPIREDATTTFGYFVTAVDQVGNESDPSEMVKARLPDYRPPQAPLITGIDRNGPNITVHWTSAMEPDLAYFTLERSPNNQSFNAVGTASELSFTDSLTEGGTFWYRLTATDSSDNTSGPSPSVSTKYDPNAQPMSPSRGTLIDTNGSVLVTWEPPTSGNVAGYLIVKKDLNTGRSYDAAEPDVDEFQFLDRYAKMDHTIVYRIYTRDEHWRLSEPLILTYTPDE